nr:RNA-directed DNA polymerase, eukaryota, reverse transcriptase zinc-binding domain protein [Tanacetum cinerariifolium]
MHVQIHEETFEVQMHELGNWSINITDDSLDTSSSVGINDIEKVEDSIEENFVNDLNDLNDNLNEVAHDIKEDAVHRDKLKDTYTDQQHEYMEDKENNAPNAYWVGESSDPSYPPGFEFMKRSFSNTSKCSITFARRHKKDIKEVSLIHELNRIIENTLGLIDLPVGGRLFTWMNKSGEKYLRSHEKLWYLNVFIKQCYINVKNSDRTRKQEVMIEIHGIEKRTDDGNATLIDRDKHVQLISEINKLDNFEALDLIHKAYIKWDIEGDENTKFFHGMIKQKRSQSINGIMHDGIWMKSSQLYGIVVVTKLKDQMGLMPQDDNSSFFTLIPKLVLVNAAEVIKIVKDKTADKKMRIKQYFLMTDYALWEVIVNGDSPPPKRNVDGVEQTYPPTIAEEKLARKNQLKARGIKKRFGGNKESKKVQKTLFKQQYENFNRNSLEGLDQIYDRLQKLISQLEIHGETISQEDLNMKLLRSLPSEWKTYTLIWRNKSNLETQAKTHKMAPRENRSREPVRRKVTVETTDVNALVAQDGFGSPSLYWELHAPKPDLILADVDEYVSSESVTSVSAVATNKAKTSESKPKSLSEPLIEDWVSDSEDENETEIKSKQRKPSFAKVEFVKPNEQVKSPRESVKQEEHNSDLLEELQVIRGDFARKRVFGFVYHTSLNL